MNDNSHITTQKQADGIALHTTITVRLSATHSRPIAVSTLPIFPNIPVTTPPEVIDWTGHVPMRSRAIPLHSARANLAPFRRSHPMATEESNRLASPPEHHAAEFARDIVHFATAAAGSDTADGPRRAQWSAALWLFWGELAFH